MDRTTTTSDEYLAWISGYARDLLSRILSKAKTFGMPMLFGLGEDGTHHFSTLTFWSYNDPDESMKALRQVVQRHGLVACALMSQARVKKEDGTAYEAIVLLKRKRGGDPTMEVYSDFVWGDENDSQGFFVGDPEIKDSVSGGMAHFWEQN